MGRLIAVALWAAACFASAATYETDSTPTAAEINTLISGMVDGDTLIIADGTFSMTEKVTISGKGITMRGGGGGKTIGSSRTTHDWTTGEKAFTMYAAGGVIDTSAMQFTVGETIRVYYPVAVGVGDEEYMEGTVVSYSDPTLTLDIATVSGDGGLDDSNNDTGDEDWWIVVRPGTTTLLRGYQPANQDGYIEITEDATHNVVVEDIKFEWGAGFDADLINVNNGSGKPVIFRRCSFWMQGRNGAAVRWQVNRGLLTGCSWVATWDRDGGTSSCQGLNLKTTQNTSWTTVSTMGDDDPDGESNLYVEDCYFFGHRETAVDVDDNGRFCVRHTVFDTSTVGGHGQDTSNHGARHAEVANCAFIYKAEWIGREWDLPNGWYHPRGGTGILYNNYFESNATSFSSNGTYKFQCQNLRRAGGPNSCWSAGDGETVYPASGWPCPRQIGFGYVTGLGDTIASGYRGDFEPYYVWGNTGSETTPVATDYGGTDCTNPDSITAYVTVDSDNDGVADREIVYGEAKPGYAEYTYPHPLASLNMEAGASYGGRLRFNGTGAKPVRTDGVGQPIIFDQ